MALDKQDSWAAYSKQSGDKLASWPAYSKQGP